MAREKKEPDEESGETTDVGKLKVLLVVDGVVAVGVARQFVLDGLDRLVVGPRRRHPRGRCCAPAVPAGSPRPPCG